MKLMCLVLLLSFRVLAQDDAPTGSSPTPAPATPPPPAREQARSMIVTKFGIVASSQFLASQAGANAYLIKPVRPAQLLAHIRLMLGEAIQ